MSQPGGEEEDEIAGEEILPILRGPRGAEVAEALVGCGFYRDDPDQTWPISDCDANSGRITVSLPSGATKPFALVAGYVLVTPALRGALDAGITPELREARAKQTELAAFGFIAKIEDGDLEALCAAVRSAKVGRVPPPRERRHLMHLTEKYGQARTVIKLLNAWVDAADGACLPDVLIVLVSHLRHSGRTVEGLAHTEILAVRGVDLTDSERQVLLHQRAGLLADRYEQTGDRHLLGKARQCANRSWASGPTGHCSAVYQRLERLEKGR
jgi:hypothetical protein